MQTRSGPQEQKAKKLAFVNDGRCVTAQLPQYAMSANLGRPQVNEHNIKQKNTSHRLVFDTAGVFVTSATKYTIADRPSVVVINYLFTYTH